MKNKIKKINAHDLKVYFNKKEKEQIKKENIELKKIMEQIKKEKGTK